MNVFDARVKAVYSELPPDRTIYTSPSKVVPIDETKALEEAEDKLFTLRQEWDSLPQKLETAKQRLRKDEVAQLTQRQEELPELLYNAETAALQIQLSIINAQRPAIKEAATAARKTLEAAEQQINEGFYAQRIAQRRCDLIFFDGYAIQEQYASVEKKLAELHQRRMAAMFGPARVAA